jgi:hypothetical protein
VRVDSSGWEEAELGAVDTIDTWRHRVYRWDAAPGSHALAARTTDGDGETQIAGRAGPFPDGATGHHSIFVEMA